MLAASNTNFQVFLDKNPFIKSIVPNTRKILMKAPVSKKNNNDFNSFLTKMNNYFKLERKKESKEAELIKLEEEEKEEIEENSQINSFFEIDIDEVDNIDENEIIDKFYKKILNDENELWNGYSLKEKEFKKQIANFKAKSFIIEKTVAKIKKKNKELELQNKNYEEQVHNLYKENEKNLEDKKKYDEKLNRIKNNFKINEDVYSTLKHLANKNIEQIDDRAYCKASKQIKLEILNIEKQSQCVSAGLKKSGLLRSKTIGTFEKFKPLTPIGSSKEPKKGFPDFKNKN